MPRSLTLTYPQTPINKINRYDVRATYDLQAIHSIINAASVVHVSLNSPSPENPFPICLPMVGVAASYEHPSAGLDEPLDVYLHGYVSSRMTNMSRTASSAPIDTANGSGQQSKPEGIPVTISATLVDGLVLSLTPNTHDINYRSATLFGYATPVTSVAEKLWAMETITNSVVPDRWRHTRVPPDGAEMQSTAILRVKIAGGSGKVRVGGVRDEKKDLEGDGVRGGVWTGVIPVWEALGEPVRSGGGELEKAPEHVEEWVRQERERREDRARGVVEDKRQG